MFRALARVHEPRGIGAVVRQRWTPLADARPAGCWVALETVQSPGNLGAIIRTGEAVGAAGLILIGDAVDPYDPACVRATMGSLFAQRLVRTSAEKLRAWAGQHGVLMAGTSPDAAVDYRAVAYRPPVVLLMGWERRGLSAEGQSLCDVMVRIPMAGRTDSLNLAVATGVMLYEIFSQGHPAAPAPLPPTVP